MPASPRSAVRIETAAKLATLAAERWLTRLCFGDTRSGGRWKSLAYRSELWESVAAGLQPLDKDK